MQGEPITMNHETVAALVADGSIFRVEYIRRKRGTWATMRARVNVTKHEKGVTGKGAAYEPAEHNLLAVWSVSARGYRSIPLDGITALTVRGVRYVNELL